MAADRVLAAYWGATAVALCLLAPMAPQISASLPDCLFHALTGLPCFTCGSTRALLALARWDAADALVFNPLVTLGALLFVLGGFAAGIAALAGRSVRLPVPVGATLRRTALLSVAANWAWLLLHTR